MKLIIKDNRWYTKLKCLQQLFFKKFLLCFDFKKNYFLNLEYVKEVIEVINMYLLPIISCIIQQTGYENIQTY